MSRIGNRIINVPSGVNIDIQPKQVNITGPKGNLVVNYNNKLIQVEKQENTVNVKRANEEKTTRMLHGTINALISNAVIGVTQEFKNELVLKGVGYKAKSENGKLNLSLGFSHPLELLIPKGLRVETPTVTEINVIGSDKQAVGEFCAIVRSYRMPEPYKGKGVLFKNEQIIRKTGKKADK